MINFEFSLTNSFHNAEIALSRRNLPYRLLFVAHIAGLRNPGIFIAERRHSAGMRVLAALYGAAW